MSSSVKCIFANVNSLVSRHKRHYLRLFLDEHRPDVMLLAEHKLSARHRIEFKGYQIFLQIRPSAGGGTAVLVRDEIRCERIYLDLGGIESTCVKIHRAGGTPLLAVAMYHRPGDSLDVSNFDFLGSRSGTCEMIIGADLNARHIDWGGDDTCTKGRVLYDFLVSCPDLHVVPTDGPTRISRASHSYIDICVASPGINVSDNGGRGLRTLDYESDHRAVEMVIVGSVLVGRELTKFFDYDRMDRRHLNRMLEEGLAECGLPLDRSVTCSRIDTCVESMSLAFREAMDASIPKVPFGCRGLRNLSPEILVFIREKKRLRRTLHRTGDPGRYNTIKADIRNLDIIIQEAIRVFEREQWANYLRSIRLNNRTFRKVKGAAGVRSRVPVADLFGDDGILVTDDRCKADILADSVQGEPSDPGDGTPPLDEVVQREVAVLDDRTPAVEFSANFTADGTVVSENSRWRQQGFVAPADVGAALRTRRNRRSSGPDGVPDIVLRATNEAIWSFLAVLFNHCLNLGYFPVAWKESITIPILKPGKDPSRSGSYRPISLLSVFGKLLEYFVLSRIRVTLDDRAILSDSQFGFRQGLSTSHALMVLGDYVSRGLNRRHITIAVSLDFAKAFDSVWHDAIVYKLKTMGFEWNTCRMVANFLNNRTFKVKVGDSFSRTRSVLTGVPQGSLLGPVLYNIFVSDIPQPPSGGMLLIYADDILIALSGAAAGNTNSRVNIYLEELSRFFVRWKMRLNVDKCEGIIFKGKRRYLYPSARGYEPVLSIGSNMIRTSDRIRYLGVIFHSKFEFYRHIDHILAKVKTVFWSYLSVLRCTGGLDVRVKLLIYKQIVRPMIANAFPVWFGISSHQMERLRVWERRILVSCLGLRPKRHTDGTWRYPSSRSVYDSIDFDRIDVFLIKGALKFLDRASFLENGLIRNSLLYDNSLQRLITDNYRPPVSLLTLDREGLLIRDDRLLFYHRRFGTLDIADTVYNTYQ